VRTFTRAEVGLTAEVPIFRSNVKGQGHRTSNVSATRTTIVTTLRYTVKRERLGIWKNGFIYCVCTGHRCT